MRFGISLIPATILVFAAALAGGPLTMPAFRDGTGAPKTIMTIVVHAHPVTSQLLSLIK